jgi:hypothetical protein
MVERVDDLLGMEQRQVRVFFYEGASSFGASLTRWDTAQAAALMSQLAGSPVRLQLMRWDEHGWDMFGPAQLMDTRGGIDANGKIVACELVSLMQADTSNLPTTRELLGKPYPTPDTAAPNTSNTAEGYANREYAGDRQDAAALRRLPPAGQPASSSYHGPRRGRSLRQRMGSPAVAARFYTAFSA